MFIFAEEVRLSPMKDMALDGAARLRLAVSAFPSGQTPFSPYGNSSASGSVTQNRNRTRSGGTQYSKMTHWVTLEVPRRPIPVTESDAKSLNADKAKTGQAQVIYGTDPICEVAKNQT